MRLAGSIRAANGLGLHDHLCWSYEDHDELLGGVIDFLADGLALGQQVRYVASGRVDDLTNDLRPLATDPGRRRDAVQAVSLDVMYRTGVVVEPGGQVQAYARATADAVTAGFTGLRVAVEATPLARGPEQLDAFARYEHLVDRYMTSEPFAALCAYNRVELGDEAVVQLACMHPVVAAGATPFRLHAMPGVDASLSGELDLASSALFPLALERAGLWPTGGEIVIEASGLTFVDHNGLLTLDEFGRRRGATVVLRAGWPGARRLAEVLELPNVRVEPPV